MAQKNVTIAGNQYPTVPSIEVPITGGGTASFIEISDTTATVDKVLQGYDFYDASGQKCTGTASTNAIAVVDTPDSHGGTIREITAVDISNTTATAEDVKTGKVFYTSDGTETVGTGSGGEPLPVPIYTLGETVFNGSSFIDTGIQLENVDQDYSILCSAYTNYNDAQTCLLHCMHEATPWNGMCVDFPTSSMRCIWKSATNSADLKNIGFSGAERDFRVAISHEAGSGIYNTGVINLTNGKIVWVPVSNSFASASENLLVGAIQSTSGTKSRYFRGTLRELKIFDEPLDEAVCQTYLKTGVN